MGRGSLPPSPPSASHSPLAPAPGCLLAQVDNTLQSLQEGQEDPGAALDNLLETEAPGGGNKRPPPNPKP